MADDLRDEAQKRAAAALPDDLPLIAALYERTVRLGVWKKASEAGSQASARTAALTELRKAGEEIDRTVAQAAPAMGEFLRPMAGAVREVAAGLERGEAPPEADPAPLPGAGHGSPQALLASLVMQSLRLIDQADPIERAESSGEVADHLSLAIQMASARGQHDEARRLGEHLTAVMQQAVRPNLDLARQGAQGDDMSELVRASTRADEAVQVLGLELGKSGPAASPAREAENALKDLSKTLRRIGSQRRGPRPLWEHEVRGVVVALDVSNRRVSLRLKDRGQDVTRAYEVAVDTRVRHGPGWLSVWAVPIGTTLRGSHRNGRLAELRVDRPD